jgi:hypothetical protein
VVFWGPRWVFGRPGEGLWGSGRGYLRADWSFGSPVDLWGPGVGLWGFGGGVLWEPGGLLGAWGTYEDRRASFGVGVWGVGSLWGCGSGVGVLPDLT